MDDVRSIEAEIDAEDKAGARQAPPPEIGSDERRMHVRAYNFWVSLLGGRAYPAIGDLDPGHAADFGTHSVLLDFTGGTEDPAIGFLGEALRLECNLPHAIRSIADVPTRSLLSRLTDHYLQILANRAPIGFEAEFVNHRGHSTMYRGILMPFSSDGDTIDFVYGVINWKEVAAPAPDFRPLPRIDAPLPAPGVPAPVWADGPGAGLDDLDLSLFPQTGEEDAEDGLRPGHNAALADHLATARTLAEQAQGARLKSRAALYRALGLAHDFALVADARPGEYAELLVDAGVKVQRRAPMTAVIRLVFGEQTDKARATEFAAVLSHARRIGLGGGALASHLEMLPGGLKAMVAAERIARRPAAAPPSHAEIARAALRKVAPQAWLDLPSDEGEFVLLLARREGDGRLAVIAPIPEETVLVDRAIRKITR